MALSPTESAHRGNRGQIGALLAFTRGSGVILRCSACENEVLWMVRTTEAIYLAARGRVYLRLKR